MAGTQRPNIVLMVADDHGREALGCYGNGAITTQHIDALAADGVRFTNAFCTTSSCAPSRSVILTGLHNHTNGTYGLSHAAHHFSCLADTITLPAMLTEAGYRTGRTGKKHYAPEDIFPFDWDPDEHMYGRDDVRMSEDCRAFVRGEEPFFLYWCSRNPHRGNRLENHPLRPNDFGNPLESFPGDMERAYSPDDVRIPPFLPDTPEVRAELAQYYQSIARLDRGIGRLMRVLRDEGKYDDTVIIYISDNGIAFPEAKTTLYEPGMCLPCIVKSPLHNARGTTSNGLISWADMTPTILDFADAQVDPESFHGRSFTGIIDEEEPTAWREEIFASHSFHAITGYYPMRVVRTPEYKFIWNIAWKLDYPFASDLYHSTAWQAALRDGAKHFGARSVEAYVHRPRFELYNLAADPDEINNLAEEPQHHELMESFIGKIKDFQKRTRDPWLHKWQYE